MMTIIFLTASFCGLVLISLGYLLGVSTERRRNYEPEEPVRPWMTGPDGP